MADHNPVILWDIDGTLLEAGNGGLDQYHQAIAEVTGSDARVELSTHGKTDWQVINELLAASGLPRSFAQAVSARLDENSARYLNKERLVQLPRVNETLQALSFAGIRNGLLTGNSLLRSRHKLVGAGVNADLIAWAAGFFGARAEKRSDLAIQARLSLPHVPMLIIGDTPFDGEAASAADIPFIAVCTGRYEPRAFDDIPTLYVLKELDVETIVKSARGLAIDAQSLQAAAREVSRFARNSRDWQQFIEICRVADTVLIDQETVENGGAKLVHCSGWIVLLRAA